MIKNLENKNPKEEEESNEFLFKFNCVFWSILIAGIVLGLNAYIFKYNDMLFYDGISFIILGIVSHSIENYMLNKIHKKYCGINGF